MSTRRAVVALVVCLCVLASACGSSKPKAVPVPPPVDARGQKAVEVDTNRNQFVPAGLIVDVGTKVTWKNTDAVAHDVKKGADALDFGAPFGVDASEFGPGASYSFTFVKAGTYYYPCSIHMLMSGKVEVVAKP
jgi:plastocyanin